MLVFKSDLEQFLSAHSPNKITYLGFFGLCFLLRLLIFKHFFLSIFLFYNYINYYFLFLSLPFSFFPPFIGNYFNNYMLYFHLNTYNQVHKYTQVSVFLEKKPVYHNIFLYFFFHLKIAQRSFHQNISLNACFFLQLCSMSFSFWVIFWVQFLG